MKRMMVTLLSMGLAFTLAGCSGGDSAASSAAGGGCVRRVLGEQRPR